MRYAGERYWADIQDDRFILSTVDGAWFALRACTAVDSLDGEDADSGAPELSFERSCDRLRAVWTGKSSLWEKKEYILALYPDRFEYAVRVHGKGHVTRAAYFIGDRNARFPGSAYEAADYEVPVMRANEKNDSRVHATAENYALTIEGFSPPMFAYAFRMAQADGRMLLGLSALDGNCNYEKFAYRAIQKGPDVSKFCMTADFEGHQVVDGEWNLPAILGSFCEDSRACFKKYADWHYDNGCPRGDFTRQPRWFKGPLFCGWKEQAFIGGAKAATQENYTAMSARLDELCLEPTAIIIDDKWQAEYGTAMPDPDKWPDLRAFADSEHAKGRRVVLWFRSWSAEGLPKDECILDESGQSLTCDPTNPNYLRRLKGIVHTLLSDGPDCYNCDGFKIDFMMCLPAGKGIRIHEPNVYGVALLKRLISALYGYSKDAKKDALFNASCGHPLFATISDQIRLHDCYFALRDSVRIMGERAELSQIGIPGISVDTDAGSCGSRRDFMAFMRACGSFGVPDLYFLNSIEDCALTDEDFREIRKIWEDYAAQYD